VMCFFGFLKSSALSLDTEIKRLEAILASEERPDPVDVATVETLKSEEVKKYLVPVLDSGAVIRGIVMRAAGTVTGVAQLNIELEWPPGSSRVSPPPTVAAVVHIQPPKVIKAGVIHDTNPSPGLGAGPLARPAGPIPATLQNFRPMAASHAIQVGADSNRALVDFLNREQMTHILLSNRAMEAGTPRYDTSGTQCTSMACFERTDEDLDDN
jgi:hypothetical protein